MVSRQEEDALRLFLLLHQILGAYRLVGHVGLRQNVVDDLFLEQRRPQAA